MYTPSQVLTLVNEALASLPYNRQPASLYEPVKYALSMGGKRLRPVLMLLSNQLFSDRPETIINQALALETYHNYTLLHDDLMDNADVRRGMPTVFRRWNANTAILSGDSMLVLAYQRMAQCDDKHLPAVMQLFTETALEIGEGQQYDMDFETRNDVSADEYIEMIRLKTSVLLACAVKMGALLADAPEQQLSLLYGFGEQMGLAFQLQDDLLDVYGDERVFGKAIGGDICANKKTYLLISALLKANPQERAELERWIAATNFNRAEKIAAVTAIYNATGVRQLCEAKIDHYFENAISQLNQVDAPEARKEPLRQLAAQMMHRNA